MALGQVRVLVNQHSPEFSWFQCCHQAVGEYRYGSGAAREAVGDGGSRG